MSKIWKNAKYLILLRNPAQTAQTSQLRRPRFPVPNRTVMSFLMSWTSNSLGGFLDPCVGVDRLDGHNVLRCTAGGDACNPVSTGIGAAPPHQEHRRPSTKVPTDANG